MLVRYDEINKFELENKLFLGDVISDLPPVTNFESRDAMPYGGEPKFQRLIGLKKDAMLGYSIDDPDTLHDVKYNHCPLQLNQDDYERTSQIPKKK
ncbi:hypothetical protein Droror1_Dr00023494 [Drosera rotundifolia]